MPIGESPWSERGASLVEKAKILIAEDEGIVALDIRGRLERLGYAVPAVVASGEEALKGAAETRPDLVLMDIRLSGPMDGIEAAEAIRGRLDIAVLYLTALSDDETMRRAEKTQPCGYITKPIDGQELRTAVERALNRCPAKTSQEKGEA
jgi:CheY-like chemotaxis protein